MTGTMEQFEALVNDELFVEKLTKLETNEEVQKAFAERGIGFTMEEIDQIVEKLYGDKSELNEDSLENVSGGVVITATTVAAVSCIAAGVALLGNAMAVYNDNRKAKGKKPIW